MKNIPKFNNQQEEIDFWDKNIAKVATFANLKKSTKTISLRLLEDMLESLKVKANALDIPFAIIVLN